MKIMKKILFFAAVLSVAFTSCMNEEFIGDNSPTTSQGTPGAIGFSFDVPQATRAGGEAAATALGKRFIVYGEKSENSDGTSPSAGNYVFPNYQVNYGANTAYTSTSNTKDWEYVGFGHSPKHHANIKTKDGSSEAVFAPGAMQTIKYWDYAATNYVFTAISADSTDVNNDYVIIQKNVSGSTVYHKGYSVTLTANADPTKLYFSDRLVITPGTDADRTAMNAYGGNVTLTFRNLVSQIRVGMYETIPGYSVTIDKFHYVDNASPTFASMTEDGTDKFYANVPNLTADKAATLTVTYIASGSRENQPTVDVTGTDNNYLVLGGADAASTGLKATAVLGGNIAAAVYDKTDKSFTPVFPQEDNDKNLKLKIDYTLTAPVTGETIKVYGATAEISAEYLQWKPNFKYTYIFKVSDNTDGKTKLPDGVNPDSPEGLYPITFDAVEIVAEDGQAEYITTVSEPSITTFGVKDGAYTTSHGTAAPYYDYPVGSDIYATFSEGSTVETPILGTSGAQHVNIFKVTTPDADNFPITEASVAEAIANPASFKPGVDVYSRSGSEPSYTYTKVTDATTLAAGTTYYKTDGTKAPGETGYEPTVAVEGTDYEVAPIIKAVGVNDDATTNFSAAPAVVGSVPAEDGTTIYHSVTLSSEPTNWATTYSTYYTDNTFATPASSAFSAATYYRKFAVKLTGVAAGTYAIEYEASAAWTGTYTKVYKIIVVQ